MHVKHVTYQFISCGRNCKTWVTGAIAFFCLFSFLLRPHSCLGKVPIPILIVAANPLRRQQMSLSLTSSSRSSSGLVQHRFRLTAKKSIRFILSNSGREVREVEGGKLVDAKAPLYADEAATQVNALSGLRIADTIFILPLSYARRSHSMQMKAAPKKSNLSKEMKQRLRDEYVGLGGAEGKVRPAMIQTHPRSISLILP